MIPLGVAGFLFWSQEEAATAQADLGPWTCLKCGHDNVPLSVRCQNCKVHRFSASYLHLPRKQPVYEVLQAGEVVRFFQIFVNVCDLSLLEGRGEKKSLSFVVCFFDVSCNSTPDSRECRSGDCFCRRLKAGHSQCQNSQAS